MAKFSACYRLCPLIDQKSFLGVREESVNGCIIVTLGKNMVIRYKLSDQKQVSSWSSTDKLSAPVVYNAASQQYIGVFNASQISTWEDTCVQLNAIKKFKFTAPIECVLTSSTSTVPVVVFRSGIILPLEQALQRRKEPPPKDPLLSKDETISEAHLITLIGSVMVAIFTTTAEGDERLHLIPVEEGLLKQTTIKMTRKVEDNVKLIGYTLVTYESTQLLTAWSDGQLFSLDLLTPDSEMFPGKILTTLSAISPRCQVAILSLSPSHLAIYGADSNEEGAVLFIVNQQLCVTQCTQRFKLYTVPARLWPGGRTALLVADGQYLVVVPFTLGKQRLAALVGSQDPDSRHVMQPGWNGTTVKQEVKDNNHYLYTMIQSYMDEGMSQRVICESLFVPTLDAKDIDGVNNLLEAITDIPETCIVAVLSMCLENVERAGCRELLRRVLSLPVTTDLKTLQLLRRLKLGSVLTLLRELSDAMLVTPADPQLVEWATLLLDAHYQQYLLSRDEAIVQTLTELKAVVDKQIEDMKVWQQLEPFLLQLQNRQSLPDPSHITNTTYCIEQIKLY